MAKVNLDVSEKLDITCRKGDTFSLSLTLKDSNGTALTLSTSGYEFLMQVRSSRKVMSKGKMLERELVIGTVSKGRTSSQGINFTFTTDDLGVATITVDDDTMRKVTPGRYVYDLQQIVSSVSTTILKGNFIINDDISDVLV
jgi:hypothetical protein|tara:strand:+ start:15797 stop:16222 length:426 start_codon:yes stop_codon:yes gene_type:complete